MAAVGLPAGDAGRKVLVRVGDAAVVLFLEFVLDGVGGGIAGLPESFDKLVALLIVRELLECDFLLIADDVGDVFIQPLLIRFAQLTTERFRVFFFLLIRQGALERVGLLAILAGLRARSGIAGVVGLALLCKN